MKIYHKLIIFRQLLCFLLLRYVETYIEYLEGIEKLPKIVEKSEKLTQLFYIKNQKMKHPNI